MGFTSKLRGVVAGVGLALLATIGGFVAGMFRRRPPSRYVSDGHAPPADPVDHPHETDRG